MYDNFPKFDRVLMHLRKSRADVEAEAQGQGETLARHKKTLMNFAKQFKINVVNIRYELESGESLIHRPDMLLTLDEVEQGMYDGVLCMDIDRLGRGKMQDQGIILETFKNSNTKIITPRKIYDLNNEMDEEYSEWEAFKARSEYKMINRRLQNGRMTSILEGNYLGTVPPYGYLIEKKGHKNRYLIHHPEQGPVVQLIFEWYTHDDPTKRMGGSAIASKLNDEIKVKSYTGKEWTSDMVLNILKNPAHGGYVKWKSKEIKKSTTPGKKRDTRTRPKDEWILVEGKHTGLVSRETYNKAQEILAGKYHVPYQLVNGITNPLAGLIKCGKCGSSMVYRPYTRQKPHIICYNQLCKTKSTRFEFVEERVLFGLKQWLENYKAEWGKRKRPQQKVDVVEIQVSALESLKRELKSLEEQKVNLHDLLERRIYDEATYLERSKNISERIHQTKKSIIDAKKNLELESKQKKIQTDIIPKIENILELYTKTDDPAKKNALLKSVLDYAVYEKEKTQRGDDFTLVLNPKIPH